MRPIPNTEALLVELLHLPEAQALLVRRWRAAHPFAPKGSIECLPPPDWRYSPAGMLGVQECSKFPAKPNELRARPPKRELCHIRIVRSTNSAGNDLAIPSETCRDRPSLAAMIPVRTPTSRGTRRRVPDQQ